MFVLALSTASLYAGLLSIAVVSTQPKITRVLLDVIDLRRLSFLRSTCYVVLHGHERNPQPSEPPPTTHSTHEKCTIPCLRHRLRTSRISNNDTPHTRKRNRRCVKVCESRRQQRDWCRPPGVGTQTTRRTNSPRRVNTKAILSVWVWKNAVNTMYRSSVCRISINRSSIFHYFDISKFDLLFH